MVAAFRQFMVFVLVVIVLFYIISNPYSAGQFFSMIFHAIGTTIESLYIFAQSLGGH